MDAVFFAQILYLLVSGVAMSFAHCPLMCSPLAAHLPHPLAYCAARSAGYIALCALAYSLGFALAPGANGRAILLFAAGCALVLLAAALAFRGRLLAAIESRRLAALITQRLLAALRRKSLASSALAGVLNAFLPCGLVYFYAAYAASAQSFALAICAGAMLGALSSAALMCARTLQRLVFWRFAGPLLLAAQGVYLALNGLMLYE